MLSGFVLVLAASSFAPADGATADRQAVPAFADSKLTLTERVDDSLIVDVDGDGHPDLVVESGRDLRAFLFRNGGVAPGASATVRLDATSFLWSFARVGGPKPMLMDLGSRGLVGHPWKDGAWAKAEDFIVHPSVFDGSVSDAKCPLHAEFLPDLDGDGLDDALLFQEGAVLVFPQSRGDDGRAAFRLRERIRIPTESTFSAGWMAHQRLTETVRTPQLAFGDVDGDKKPDITWIRRETMGTFLQGADGRFAATGPRDLAVSKSKPRNTFIKFEAPPIVRDLNGDGLLDMILDYPSKGRVHIFMNRSGRNDFTTPDEVITVDGWTPGVDVVDLDGDGKLEITVGVVRKFGLMSGIDAFTTKKVRLELMIFRINNRGAYGNEPVQQIEFSIPYLLQATRESASADLIFRPNFSCDLDGDGRIDLIVEKESKALEVYPGIEGKMISDRAAYEIPLHPPEHLLAFDITAGDINGDKKSDLVIRYKTPDRKGDQVEVKLSQP